MFGTRAGSIPAHISKTYLQTNESERIMKETIKHAVNYIALGIIATALVLAVFTLFLAMPSILDWLAGYIGTTFTWVLFIFSIGAVITYCLAD